MNDLSEFVVLSDTTLTTDSRRVAKHFKKRHADVLRAFDKMGCPDEYRQRNFAETVETRENPSGGAPISSRVVKMTKNGFMLLVMGFTGNEATRVKIAFIDAFDAMAEQLQRIGNSLWAQRLDLEKREATSFMWASFGAKRMQERRYEKPLLENERAILDAEMQPTLFQSNVVHLAGHA